MRVVRRCDDDGVEWLLEELGGVGEGGGDLPLPGERRGAVGVAAEDGGHVDTIKASQRREVHRIGPPGRADDADADCFVMSGLSGGAVDRRTDRVGARSTEWVGAVVLDALQTVRIAS